MYQDKSSVLVFTK